MQDVKVNRNLYIGGSDIPVIMGISPFKKRYDLLLEKAGLKEDTFEGNEYTEYGNILEPQIRDFINSQDVRQFKEDKLINGDIRCHVDGWDEWDTILEIKTTSQIHKSVDEYKVYLVQLLFYMLNYNAQFGKLAVYERPKDFDTTFYVDLLKIYNIDVNDYQDLARDILNAVNQFKRDLEKLKANPFITEEELQPNELIELSNQVVILENKLAAYKELEAEYKNVKQELFNAMEKYNVKKWTTNNGVQITKIDSSPDTTETIQVFNEDKFKEENSELYDKYLEEKTNTKKGRSGYVKITMPKVN